MGLAGGGAHRGALVAEGVGAVWPAVEVAGVVPVEEADGGSGSAPSVAFWLGCRRVEGIEAVHHREVVHDRRRCLPRLGDLLPCDVRGPAGKRARSSVKAPPGPPRTLRAQLRMVRPGPTVKLCVAAHVLRGSSPQLPQSDAISAAGVPGATREYCHSLIIATNCIKTVIACYCVTQATPRLWGHITGI